MLNAACTGNSIRTTVDDGTFGRSTSIAIGTDGLPVISYHDPTAGTLRVAKCSNAACSGNSTITEVDNPANFVGSFNSIAIGAEGLPVISYHDATASTLRVARCGNAACSSGNMFALIDDNNVGSYTSIAVATDGLPIISYHDGNAGNLKVVKCSTPGCR